MTDRINRLRQVTVAKIVDRACTVAFGNPLVANNLRSMLVEAMVTEALPEWRCTSADWAGWDFESAEGIRLEVKQSAARQTWTKEGDPPSKCSFDIATRAGYYEGARWTEGRRRYADIFVLAHHPRDDADADHRDPHQWDFYVVRETCLPSEGKTITLSGIQSRGIPSVGFVNLETQVEAVKAGVIAARVPTPPRTAPASPP